MIIPPEVSDIIARNQLTLRAGEIVPNHALATTPFKDIWQLIRNGIKVDFSKLDVAVQSA